MTKLILSTSISLNFGFGIENGVKARFSSSRETIVKFYEDYLVILILDIVRENDGEP